MKDWVDKTVDETHKEHKELPDPVADKIKSLLDGDLGKDALTTKNLKLTANLLIKAMEPKPNKVEPEENAD